MKPLGEDWFAVGEVYFRFLDLFDLPWGQGFDFTRFKIAVGEASGHIVMLLDGQPGCKPVLQIFTASGKLVSQQLWKDAPPLTIGWSAEEELLVIQKTGFISVLDLSGNFLKRFTMGPEAEERGILDARFFHHHGHTGIAVLTGGNRIFLTSKIDTPRIRRLAELSGPGQAISLWEIVTCPLDLGPTKPASNSFQGPWALIARKTSIIRTDFSTAENVEIPALTQLNSPIRLMSVSSSMKFVSLYLENGYLLVTNLRMSEIHSQIDLSQRISVMLPSSDAGSPQSNHPRTMLWLTNSAVVLQWTHLIALVGAHGDIYESFCPEDVWLTQEMDVVRMLTATSHKLLQRVPPALEALGRIGASCPATWLVSASANLQAGSGRANDYLLPIRTSRQMIEAISHCIEAASHAVFDTNCQKNLLEAAHMGQIFLSAMFTDAQERPNKEEINKLGERAANACRCLRVLNNLATPWIALALTWTQFQHLGPRRLLQRLLARKHYPMAVEFVRTMLEVNAVFDSPQKSSSSELGISLTQVLSHWACHSSSAGNEDSAAISERLARIVERIYQPAGCSTLETSVPARIGPERLPSLGSRIKIDFAEVANQALVANREKVAEQLIEYEARAWHQVPLLLKLGRYNRALVRAVETGDPELIAVVVAALQDQAKLPPADLAMVLRKHPIAMAIYHETWGNGGANQGDSGTPSNATHTAIISFDQEDDRAAQAKKAILQAYNETNLQHRLNALQRAEETYKQMKNDFMSQECNAAARLLRFQSKLEKQELKAPVFQLSAASTANQRSAHHILPTPAPSSAEENVWVGQPLHTTLARLLSIPQGDRLAEQLRREFRVSEKRYAYLRLIGLALQNDWPEIEKMAKAKKMPFSIETFIKVCVDCNHFEEAHSLVPRLPVERRVRYWLICGQIEQAIQAAVQEKSDSDLRLIQEHVGKENQTVYNRIAKLRQQIRS